MAGSGGERRTKGGRAKSRASESAGAGDAKANGGPGHGGAANLMIDLDFVRGLIAAVDESGIDSIDITRAGTRIRISKSPLTVAASTPVGVPRSGPAAEPAALAPPPAQAPAAQPEPAAAPAPSRNLFEVKSPMVGTFYRAPAPEAPPYVEVGSAVGKGQTLCILEAMKLMNELESEVEGVVREVLVENADPVEYGQVLFRIEPAGSSA